jgi:hypothetical protein
VSGRDECVSVKLQERRNLKVYTHCCSIGEDVANIRFELGVEISAAEMERVLVICCPS